MHTGDVLPVMSCTLISPPYCMKQRSQSLQMKWSITTKNSGSLESEMVNKDLQRCLKCIQRVSHWSGSELCTQTWCIEPSASGWKYERNSWIGWTNGKGALLLNVCQAGTYKPRSYLAIKPDYNNQTHTNINIIQNQQYEAKCLLYKHLNNEKGPELKQ